MYQPRLRWFINIVLVIGAIAFVGISIIPLISTSLEQSQPASQATPATSPTPAAEQQAKLANEARGYELVLQQDPENQVALQSLAQARIQLGDLDGAIAPLKKLTTLAPQQVEYTLVLGQVYATQQNFDAAISAYDQAIKTNKEDFRPVLAKATLLRQQGKTEQAKPLFDNAIAIAPEQYKEQIKKLAAQLSTPPAFQPEQPAENK